VRQLLLQFGQSNQRFTAEVRFVIRRDGSVDPASIKIVTSSGNYSFDSRVLGAVEAAANAKAFGTLPPGFQEDILPVNFRFSPQIR
jgi:TonB family protein